MKRWIIPAIYSTALILAFAYRHEIMDWLGENPPLYLMILLAALLALFPVAPYKAPLSVDPARALTAHHTANGRQYLCRRRIHSILDVHNRFSHR